jgi:putative methionine-R-sulfoxide reductase with GAF domain
MVDQIAGEHGEQRALLEFKLDDVLGEYVVLRQVLFQVLEQDGPLPLEERDLIFEAIQEGMLSSARRFIDLNRQREQTWVKHLESEQKWFEAVLDWLPIPTLLIEPSTADVKFLNKSAREMSSLIPRHFVEMESRGFYATDRDGKRIPSDQLPRQRVSRGEKLTDYEMNWHTPLGIFPLIINGALMPGMHGRTPFAILTFQNVFEKKQAEQRVRDLHRVTEIALSRSTSMDRLLNDLFGFLRKLFEADSIAALLTVDDGNSLEVRAAHGLEEEVSKRVKIPKGRGVAGKILSTGKPMIVDDLSKVEVASQILKDRGIRCLMGVPLRVKDRVIGVIHLSFPRKVEAFWI